MKLPRPYVPKAIRVKVAERQVDEDDTLMFRPAGLSDGAWLTVLLQSLFGDQKVELHHRPALCNRERRSSISHYGMVRYIPDANDPDYLVYLPVADHDVETRVRGQHGQHSDLAFARKRKWIERKAKRPKRKWPSRPLRSRNDLKKKKKAAVEGDTSRGL